MAAETKWFVLFKDMGEYFEDLSDAAAGLVIKAAFKYANSGEITELDGPEKIVFMMIRKSIQRDNERYAETCAKNSANARKRWGKQNHAADSATVPELSDMPSHATACESMPSNATACESMPSHAKHANTNKKTNTNTNTNTNIEILSAPTQKASKTPAKHQHGMYNNVLLSDDEFEKLKSEFPADYTSRIDRLSEYMRSTGKPYKDHLATIRAWARRDTSDAKPEKPKGNKMHFSNERNYDNSKYENAAIGLIMGAKGGET